MICIYTVWQKSNETDFLLTTKFILFTNQGYPLQNSSLGQLHSDGGVVSIVRSSAGRLLLVGYVLLDIIQSTKMAPFRVVFEPGEQKEVTGTEIRRTGGLRNHRNVFFLPKIH